MCIICTATIPQCFGTSLGSTSTVTNESGVCTSQQAYYPYGAIRPITPTPPCGDTVPTDFGFTGQRRDASAGLMYYGARYYDAGLGRFVSADTIVPSAGNPQSLNRYSYVLNNPVKYVDPSGYCPFGSNGTGSYASDNDNLIDCSLDDFASSSWQQRREWMAAFQGMSGVNWFDNVQGILRYFEGDRTFSNSSWAKLSDAGVLIAIQDGWRLREDKSPMSDYSIVGDDNPASAWKKFFSLFAKGDISSADVFNAWGDAEQKGVDYGIKLAENFKLEVGMQADYFVWWGNVYRHIVKEGIPMSSGGTYPGGDLTVSPGHLYFAREIPGVTTPYNSGGFTEGFSQIVISGPFEFFYQIGRTNYPNPRNY